MWAEIAEDRATAIWSGVEGGLRSLFAPPQRPVPDPIGGRRLSARRPRAPVVGSVRWSAKAAAAQQRGEASINRQWRKSPSCPGKNHVANGMGPTMTLEIKGELPDIDHRVPGIGRSCRLLWVCFLLSPKWGRTLFYPLAPCRGLWYPPP